METRSKDPSPFIRNRRRWPLVLFGILLLLSGIVIGVAGNEYYHKVMRERFIDHPERAPRLITEKLKSELNLSAEQARKVEEVLRKRLEVLRKLQEANRPRLEEELDLLRDEVAQTLDEGQKRRWLEHFERMRPFLPPPFPPPPPGGGPGGPR